MVTFGPIWKSRLVRVSICVWFLLCFFVIRRAIPPDPLKILSTLSTVSEKLKTVPENKHRDATQKTVKGNPTPKKAANEDILAMVSRYHVHSDIIFLSKHRLTNKYTGIFKGLQTLS